MRHAPLLSTALASLALAACASLPGPATPDAPGKRAVVHPSECFDPAFARGWDYVDDDELLVDAGRRKYRIRLSELCLSLGTSPDLGFVGDQVSNRICGHVGEYVLVGRERCRIQRVERIDEAEYLEATGRDEPKGRIKAGAASQGD
ncbi:DUF6491 family protein [bacterium BD-1]|uniref:DUF6491 family protein n=1 Tax=Arenimonas sp. TaxID=1872635 RepID=UPI001E4D3B71|nr:DUF6491 family protein [Ottowia caeni]